MPWRQVLFSVLEASCRGAIGDGFSPEAQLFGRGGFKPFDYQVENPKFTSCLGLSLKLRNNLYIIRIFYKNRN